jgi:hypothetical protein
MGVIQRNTWGTDVGGLGWWIGTECLVCHLTEGPPDDPGPKVSGSGKAGGKSFNLKAGRIQHIKEFNFAHLLCQCVDTICCSAVAVSIDGSSTIFPLCHHTDESVLQGSHQWCQTWWLQLWPHSLGFIRTGLVPRLHIMYVAPSPPTVASGLLPPRLSTQDPSS